MTPENLTASPDGTYTVLGDGRYAVRFERRFDHTVEKVWAAITEPQEILGWLGEAEVDLAEGGRFVVRWLNTFTAEQAAEYGIEGYEEGMSDTVMKGTIRRLDPPRLLELDSDIFGTLRFELFDEGETCLLRFSDTFETPAEMLAQSMAGWHMHLEHLGSALEGRGITNWERWADDYLDTWAEIRDRYAAGIPNVPPASSASPPAANGSGS